MDGLDILLADFNRLKENCRKLEGQKIVVGIVGAAGSDKGLSGARFKVASENGSYSKEVVTGRDGTVTLSPLDAGTYAVTELEAPAGYEIDNAGPQYIVLPNGSDKTVTVTFTDTPEITGEGSIRKVDADNPTKGIAGAVIKITGVDNDFTGTYVTGAGGYLTDVPWKDMPLLCSSRTAFMWHRYQTARTAVMICPSTVAAAAPIIPQRKTKMKMGSRMILAAAPARVEAMANLGLPSERMMGLSA